MSVIKLSKKDITTNNSLVNLDEEDKKIKINKRQMSFDSAMVYDWETTNKSSIDTINNYYTKINNGEYLSADDIASYRTALDSYIDTSNRLRELNKRFGSGYTDEEEKKWTDTIASMNTAFNSASGYYSNFKSEKDYNDSIAYNERQEGLKNFDLDAGKVELENMRAKYDVATQLKKAQQVYNSKRNSIFGQKGSQAVKDKKLKESEEYKTYMSLLSQWNSVYGDESWRDFESYYNNNYASKNAYYHEAENLQTSITMQDTVLNADDFEYYMQKGKELDGDGFVFESFDTPIGTDNYIEHYRKFYANRLEKGENGAGTISKKASFALAMTEDEVNTYNYYLGKGDIDSANAYLDSITELVNRRQAGELYSFSKDNVFLEGVFAFSAGVEQFGTGIKNLFSDEDYYAPTAMQIVGGQIREDWTNDAGFIGQVGYDLLNTTGNMLPSILIGQATGVGFLGAASLGASAAGNAKAEFINLGYSKDQANAYGVMVGISEAALQSVLGGIGSLGGSKSLTKSALKAIDSIDKAGARIALKFGTKMLSEGVEEGLQAVLEPIFKHIVTGADFEGIDWGEVGYSALLGALSAGFLESVGTIAGDVRTQKTGQIIKNVGAIDRLNKVGELFSANSVASELAGKVNENTNPYTIGRLFNELNATLTETNKADISKYLEEKGMDTADAKRWANAFAAVVEGKPLTEKQLTLIAGNEILSKAINDVIINPNSTVYQRTMGYAEVASLVKNGGSKAKADVDSVLVSESSPQDSKTSTKSVSPTEEETLSRAEILSLFDGKTRLVEDDSEVDVKEIASIKDGVVSVRLNDDRVVDKNDVHFGNREEGLVFEAVATLGVDVDTANAIIETAREKVKGFNSNGTIEVGAFIEGLRNSYLYGNKGLSANELAVSKKTNFLPEELSKRVYNHGKIKAVMESKKAQETIKETAAKVKEAQKEVKEGTKNSQPIEKTGRVKYHNLNESTLTKRQSDQVKAVERIAKVFTRSEFTFFASYVNKQGKRVYKDEDGNIKSAPSGKFYADGRIWIDINAGNMGNGLILFTAAHELTHFAKEFSPEQYKLFADFLMEQYGNLTVNGKKVSVDMLVERQITKAKDRGRDISYDVAFDEVVADSCERFLLDGDALKKLDASENIDKGFIAKIKSFIRNLIKNIKSWYVGVNPDSLEADLISRLDKTSYKKLITMWENMLADAGETYQTISETLGNNGIMVDAKTESASLYSVRDLLDNKQQQKVTKALVERFGVSEDEAKNWISAETSLASIILNPKYSQYLDYTADPNEEAIKKNSDYPQGTVDFSNICKKRRDFTDVMNRVLRKFPNHVFKATDLAKIRTVMMEEGMEVACGICYVEDRRQLDSVVAQDFINSLALYREGSKTRPDGKPFNTNQLKALELVDGDVYTPSIYELISLEGRNSLKAKNPAMEEAWVKFNNARGMQSVRLLLNDAEYKRQILKYSPEVVKRKNDLGGLRIYSFSDMEMFHLIDIIQVITDSATVGLSIQGYTKVNEYAKAVKDTGEKLNRSLIPKGDLGYHMEKGKVVLDYDTVEGIDINHPDFFDSTDNPNVGNILIGINPTQIGAAMVDKYVDYIIPFHTGQSNEVLGEKGIAEWHNYEDSQSERDLATGKKSSHQINIYTEVIQSAENEGKPIKNKVDFVNKFLAVCKENGLKPRFAEFLNIDKNGDYVYTEGYHKFLVDFKMFDSNTGEYLPQKPVKPIFDNKYLTKLLKDYVKSQQVKDAKLAETMPTVLERITNEIVKPDVKFSDRDEILPDFNSVSELDKWFDSLSFEELNELIGGDVSIDDISEELKVEPKRIEIFIRRKGLGESHIEENRTAVMKQTRIDEEIEDSGAKFNPDYARKYITRISPKDFIDLTVSQNHVDRGQFDAKVIGDHGNRMSDFDYGKALQDSESPYLHIDQSTGRLIGHNGRHRIRALEIAGIESVEIEVQFFDKEGYLVKYDAKTIPDMAISSQFDTAIETHLSNIVPLNETHRAEIESTYGEKAHKNAGVKYSDRDSDGNELSAAQIEYFKGSKVRDEQGRLLLCNHATADNTFTVFDQKKTGKNSKRSFSQGGALGRGFYFSTPQYAYYEWNDWVTKTTGKPAKSLEVYLNITNPFYYDYSLDTNLKDFLMESVTDEYQKEALERKKTNIELISFCKDWDIDIQSSLKAIGYDGIIEGEYQMVAFNSNQIKLTTNKNPTSDQDIRYSDRVTPQEDEEYMDAYFDGDEDKMQELVDRVANRLGYKYKAYHHTENGFTVFDLNKARKSMDIQGFFFSADMDAESEYGSVRYDTYLKMDNPYVVDSKETQNAIPFDMSKPNAGVIAREWLQKQGYDSVIRKAEYFGAEADEYIVFDSNQIKSAEPMTYSDDVNGEGDIIPLSERFNSENIDIRYSDRGYSYEALTSKPDMKVTTVGGAVPNNRADVVVLAKKNASAVGKTNKDGSVSVYVDDIETDVILSTKGLRHGLRRTTKTGQDANYIVTLKAGEILKNSIRINKLTPSDKNASSSYVLIGAAKNANSDLFVVRSIVNQFDNELASMDVLYAINTKKESAALNAPRLTAKPLSVTDSIISIADLLNYVNQYFPDILPESVFRHFGHTARPKGEIGESALYQDRDSDSMSNRSLLANALETTAKNDIEKNKLAQYKQKIDLINSEEQKLHNLREQAHELRFKKGRTQAETKQMRDLEFEAKQTANRINTYDRQLLTLEASKPLKAVLEREKQIAYKKAEQKGKEAVARQRERNAQTTRELMDRYQEAREKGIERRNMTEMRHKIKKVVGELNTLLLKPSKDKHVKEELRKAVAEALSVINMDTVGADERIAKIEAEIARATDPVIIDELTASRDRIKFMGENLKAKLTSLQTAYEKIKKSEDEISNAYEEAVLDRIKAVAEEVGDTPIRYMTLKQLESVYDMYRMVLTTIRNANSVWKQGKIEELQANASAVMEEIAAQKQIKGERSMAFDKVSEFTWQEMTPVYAFERVGSKTFEEFFWEAIEGQNVFAKDVNEAKDFADKTRERYGYKKWDLDKVYEFKLKDGKTFSTTLKHLLSIYAYSKREQALDHMKTGGFFYNAKSVFRKKAGFINLLKTNPEGYSIDEDILAEIKGALTSDQLNYVDEMQEYLTKMGEKGNEVSRKVWGIDIFKEKVYFPLMSKQDFISKSTETAQAVSLKNDGMTKETVPHASNPIVLEAFDDVWANHVNRMSQYHGFVIPIDNLNKILHYGTWSGTESMSVSTLIESRHTTAAVNYLEQFIKDLNGGVSSQGATNPFIGFFTKFKKTAVGASLSTIIQQPTAILRALSLIDAKYFAGKPNLKTLSKKWAELKNYAPVAIIKDIGGFDAGVGRQVSSWLNEDALRGGDKVMNTIDNLSMKGAELADQLGWTTIWEAVKREVKANNPTMDVDSEAFLKKCGERFTEVVVKTQVYDSTLSRSGFMRSKHDTVKMLTAFMGEPTLSMNMIFNAIIQGKRGGKAEKAQAVRTIAYTYASMIAASVAASLIYALRDDDEDESYLEKYMNVLGGEFISDIVLAPITSLPAVKDVVSIFQGWDVERSDVAIFKDLKDAFDGLFSDNKNTYRKIEDFAGAIGGLFGIPVKNLLRTGREIYNTIRNIFDGIEGGDVGVSFVDGITGEEKSKTERLYEAIMIGDKERIERVKAQFAKDDMTEMEIKSAIESAMRKGLRDNDPRIREAAQAVIDGNPTERVRITREIKAEGNFSQDIIVGAINAEVTKLRKRQKIKTK